jgi:rod shape-determining protein MreB
MSRLGLGLDIGIDLGTATILVYIKGKGIILGEPSVVALDKNTNKMLAVGEEARKMLGRTPGNIVAIRPLREGVISDYQVTERMLKHFINKVCSRSLFKLFKPRVMICVPSGVTEVEKRAVEDAAIQAGARRTYLIEEPIAAAIGAGIDITKACGSMVVDIGGGTTDIAVISLGGTVVSSSTKIAGDKLDEAIVRYMRKKHNIIKNFSCSKGYARYGILSNNNIDSRPVLQKLIEAIYKASASGHYNSPVADIRGKLWRCSFQYRMYCLNYARYRLLHRFHDFR